MHKAIFADANSDYDNAKYVICGVPFDNTSCFRRGSKDAPQEMRNNSYNFEKYNSFFDIDLQDISIHDAGDLDMRDEYEGKKNSHACISRHVFEDVTKDYVSIGIRSGTRDEYEYVRENDIKVFSSEDVF